MSHICEVNGWLYLRLNLPATQDKDKKTVYWGDLDLATSDISVLKQMETAAQQYANSERTAIRQHVVELLKYATF